MRIKYKMTGHERDVTDAIGQNLINRKLAYKVGAEPKPKRSRAPRKTEKPAEPAASAAQSETAAGDSTTPNTYTTRDMRAEG